MIPCPEKSTGTTSDGTSVPQQQAPMGWVCPVCGRGNAPWAMTCCGCVGRLPAQSSPYQWWYWGPVAK